MSVSSETMIEHCRLIGSRLWRDSAGQLPWALETAVLGAGYVAAYVLGVWISDADHHVLANYSWNPNTGTSLAAVVMFRSGSSRRCSATSWPDSSHLRGLTNSRPRG